MADNEEVDDTTLLVEDGKDEADDEVIVREVDPSTNGGHQEPMILEDAGESSMQASEAT